MFRPFFLLLVVLLCGCSKEEDDLIGIWMAPRLPGMVSARITFSPDGTALVQFDRRRDIQMNWQRHDQGRFTLTQADGATWVGCLSDGEINIREPVQTNRRGRIHRYRRVQTLSGRLVFREKTSSSCIPLGALTARWRGDDKRSSAS